MTCRRCTGNGYIWIDQEPVPCKWCLGTGEDRLDLSRERARIERRAERKTRRPPPRKRDEVALATAWRRLVRVGRLLSTPKNWNADDYGLLSAEEDRCIADFRAAATAVAVRLVVRDETQASLARALRRALRERRDLAERGKYAHVDDCTGEDSCDCASERRRMIALEVERLTQQRRVNR